jgi:hypothetical protein
MARNLSHNLKRMVAGLCALMIVASQIVMPASSGGLFSDSSIVASAEGAQQYEVTPDDGDESEAGTVTKSVAPDESSTTYTATAKDGYSFVKFVYDISGEQYESTSNTISFVYGDAEELSNFKAIFVKVSDSTYNVTANTGLKYTGEEQDLVTTSGTGGTIGYAKVPDGKSVGDVVKKDIREAIVPEVGTVYTPDLNGSNGGQDGVSFDSSYRVAVDGTYYTSGGTNDPVRLRYFYSLKKYQIYDADGYHDIKDGCNAILVTNVDDTTKVITGTLVNSADYVSPSGLSWNTTVPTATDVGDYTVAWKVDGNDEYKSKAVSTVKTSIAKGDSTYNVTAKSGLAYDGDEHELVETTGKGGTISYTIVPDGKSIGDVVKRDVWEAIVPEVGKVYTPDLNGSEGGRDGVSFNPSYSFSVDGQAYDPEGDNDPVRLRYSNPLNKYQIEDIDGYHDVKDGCDAILVTEVNETNKYIVGTFVNSADYVSSDSLTWSEDIPTGTAAGSYDVYWKVDGDDNYNGKAPAKVTATIANADAEVTIEGTDFVVADSTGKTEINPTTQAGEETSAVYTLQNGSYYIYSNKTLITEDDRVDMSVGTKGYKFGDKTYKYRYITEISGIDNSDDISDKITIKHVHDMSVKRTAEKDAVEATCTGESGDTITSATLAEFNVASSYQFGDSPTEADITLNNDNQFGMEVNVIDFYFTETGQSAKLEAKDMELGKSYTVYATINVKTADGEEDFLISKALTYEARPFYECTFKIGDTELEVKGDAETGYYVEAPEKILTYNKQSQLPDVTVTAGANSTALVKDTDFVITSVGETKNAGAHTATIKAVDGSTAYDQTPVTVRFTIDKAQNQMSIAGINRIYNGEALDTTLMDGTNDYTVTDTQGVLDEEGTVVSVPNPSSTYDRKSAGKQVVEFTITTPNYVEKKISVESTISRRDATITTSEEQQTVTYGDSFSIAYTLEEANEDRGFVESDISKLATGMLTFTGDKGRMTNIGSYNDFVLKTQNPPAASKNYNLTLNNESAGTLVIGKKALTADMFSAGERIYDNKDLSIPLKAVDNVGGTNVLQASDYVVSGQTTGKTPGTYTVTINASENGNYSLESPISLTWKVVPAEIEKFMNVKDSYSYNTEIAPNMAVHTSGNDPKVGFTPGGSIKVAYYKIKDGVDLPEADADEATLKAFVADSNKVTEVSSFKAPSIGNYILKAYSTSSYVTGDAFKLVNIHKYDEGINNTNVTVWNLYDRPYDGVDKAIKIGSPYDVCISHKGPAEDKHYLGVKKSGFYKIDYAKSDTDLGVGKTPVKEQKYNVTSFSHINIVDASGDVKNYSGDSISSIQVSGDGNDIKVYHKEGYLYAICYDHEGDKDVWVVTQAENGTLTIKAYTAAELLDDQIAQGNITPTAVNAGDYVLMMRLGDDQYEDCFYSRKVTISKKVATVTPNANQNTVYGEGFTGSVGYTASGLVSGDSLNASNIVEVGQKVQSSTDSQTPAYNFDPESKTNPAGQYDYKLKSGVESEINSNYTVKLDTTNKFTVQPKDVKSDPNFKFSPIGYSVVYNASEQTVTPEFTYVGPQTDPYGNIVSGTDYDITGTFKGTNVGEYTMTLTAKGNYTGTFNVPWVITAADITSVVVDPDKFDYTAANDPQKSGIKVNGVQTAGQDTTETTDDKFEPLTEGKDYEIRYIPADPVTLEVTDEIFNAASTNVKDVGSYVAIVKGKGNYKGYTLSNAFEIKKAQSSSAHYDVTFNGGNNRVYNGESVANGDFAVSANESASAAEKENPAITGIEYYKVPTGTTITPETDLEKLVEGVDADATEIGPNVEVSSNDVGKYLKDGDYTVANIALVIDGQYFSAGVHEGKFKINGGQFSTDNGEFTVGNVSDNKRWKITNYDGMLYIDAVDPPVEGLTPMTTTPVVDQLEPGNRTITAEDKGKYLADGEYTITNSGYLQWAYYELISANTKFVINGGKITITEDGRDYSTTKNAGENKCWKITEVNEQGKVTIAAVDVPAEVAAQPKDAGKYIAKLTVKSDSTEPSTIYKAFDIQKKAVNVTLGHEDITWGTLIDKNTVYTIDPDNGFISENDIPDFNLWFSVFRTEQGGEVLFGFDFNNAIHNDAATYNIKALGGTDGKTLVDEYNADDKNYTINVTEGTMTVKPYELQQEDVTLDAASFKYDGEDKAPTVTVNVHYDNSAAASASEEIYTLQLGTKRAPGKDGYIGGTSRISDAGVWTLLVVGDGNFTGTIKQNWSIDKASMKVELDDIAERPYDGTATEVTAKVKNTDVTVNEVGPGTVKLSADDVGKYLKDGKYTFRNAVGGIHELNVFAPDTECTVSGGQIFVNYGDRTVSYGNASDNKRWKIASFDAENDVITLEVVNDPTAVDLEESGVTVTYKYEKLVTSGDAVGTWEEVSEAKDAGGYRVTATVQGNDNFDVSEEDATAAKVFEITQRDVKVTLNADDLTKSNGYKDGTVHVTYGEGDVVESDGITLPETIDIGTGVADGTEITADNEAFADIKTALGSNYNLVVSGDPIVKIKAAKLASVEVKTSYIKESGGDEFVSPVFIAKDENGNDFDVSKIVVVKGADEINVAKSYNITVSDESTLDDPADDFKLVWDVKETGKVELASYNTIRYSDNVVMNFFATIEKEDCVDGAYVLFKYNHYGEDIEVKVDVDKTKMDDGEYVFSCNLNAREMTIDVTAELYLKDSTEPVSVKSRSISDYAHVAAQKAKTAEERNVAKAMLNYGAYTQILLDYNTDSLPNTGLEIDVSDITVESNVNFVRPTAEVEGIKYTGSTGVFTSAPTNRHYFKLAKSSSINDYVFKINGVEVTPVSDNGGEYFIECDPIKAYKMDDVQNVVVEKKDGTPVFDFDYSMVTYLKLASEKGNAAQKNQAKAMYNYYKAAVDFVNSKN